MLLFRSKEDLDYHPSPEKIQSQMKVWAAWIDGIMAQGKFIGTNALEYAGKTLLPDGTITDGPYTELKEIVGGYILVKAIDWDDAIELAKGCPVRTVGGKVEVRPVRNFG